jgi:hypothetical protein
MIEPGPKAFSICPTALSSIPSWVAWAELPEVVVFRVFVFVAIGFSLLCPAARLGSFTRSAIGIVPRRKLNRRHWLSGFQRQFEEKMLIGKNSLIESAAVRGFFVPSQ